LIGINRAASSAFYSGRDARIFNVIFADLRLLRRSGVPSPGRICDNRPPFFAQPHAQ